jgi:hypothetical protein
MNRVGRAGGRREWSAQDGRDLADAISEPPFHVVVATDRKGTAWRALCADFGASAGNAQQTLSPGAVRHFVRKSVLKTMDRRGSRWTSVG